MVSKPGSQYREGSLTIQWIPKKYRARFKSTPKLIYPGIVEGHPWRLFRAESTGLDAIPEITGGSSALKPRSCQPKSTASQRVILTASLD